MVTDGSDDTVSYSSASHTVMCTGISGEHVKDADSHSGSLEWGLQVRLILLVCGPHVE